MSLDNVLAVAGVSRHSPEIMAFGLVLAVVLMGVAATFIARVIEKYRWIAWAGLIIIVFAAIRMIWEDAYLFFPDVLPPMPAWLGGHHAAPAAAH
jgi:predicted tellurium resistance membrane protein TerC